MIGVPVVLQDVFIPCGVHRMRVKIDRITAHDEGTCVVVMGWVKSVRHSKSCTFIVLNDGSDFDGIQVIVDTSGADHAQLPPDIATGAAMSVKGTVVKSPGSEQAYEIKADEIELIGACPPERYPLQKKHHTFEFLRSIAHLRARTNTIGAVARVRNALAFATHTFFQSRGFLYVTTPIITTADCEGAGQMFRVSTLDFESIPRTPDGRVDFSKDFFGKPAYLTVSGQLDGEAYACALSDIYTFGPTFRAENSNTSRHLAEFWMIEPEMAFADLNDDIECAQEYIRFCLNHVLTTCERDIAFFDKFVSVGLAGRLEAIVNEPFARVTYTEAVEILAKAPAKFEYPVSWGMDLQAEHERYLVEEHFKKPLVVYNYPAAIKAFYMRSNDDGKTVAAMDILVATIGELVGGSQREERYDVLVAKMKDFNLDPQNYWWYLDLRAYGTVPHAGFGLGFERLVRLATGMDNIRDVIPFPRYPGNADF